MKKLLLLAMMFIFASCASAPKITYTQNNFYKEKFEYRTEWVKLKVDSGRVNLRLVKLDDNKIYLQGFYSTGKSFHVLQTDAISLRFNDNSVMKLYFDGVLSKPIYNYRASYLNTKLKSITSIDTLEYIRVDTSLGYDDNTKIINKKDAEKLNILFDRLENNEYDKKN